MVAEESIYGRLAAKFPASAHKTKSIGGRSLTYVDGEMVISRLNEELGIDGWAFEVKDIHVLEAEVWALGRMTAYWGDRAIVREQAGGQIINRNRNGEIIELGNDIKGAITDCLKKCASLLGVGLYLFNPEERQEVEAEMRGAKRPTPLRPATVATSDPSASAPTAPTAPAGGRPSKPRPEPTVHEQSRAVAMVGKAAAPAPDATRAQLIAALATNIRGQRSLGAEIQMPTGKDMQALSDAELRKMVIDTGDALNLAIDASGPQE